MTDINVKANVQRTSTLGKVKVLVEQVVGSPSQAQISQAVADYIDSHPGALSPLSQATKSAMLDIAAHVAYIDANGQSYYDALDAALNAKALLSITAVYTQSGTVYDTDSLDSLKADLVVTAYYDDGTSAVVSSGYTLSGTLAEGTSTITVEFGGKTATFDVAVSEYKPLPDDYTQYDYIWAKNQSTGINIYTGEQINTATYANLNVLGCEFDYLAESGHATVALFGGRPITGNTKSYAFYPQTNALGYHLHGNDSAIKPTATDGVLHHVIYTNTSASPSTLQVDSDSPVSITWNNNNEINRPLTLLCNPYTTPTSLSRGVQIGRIKMTDLEGNIVGDYIPCVRNADNVIGIYDAIGREFHTATTVAACTIGASACRYAVGNWE